MALFTELVDNGHLKAIGDAYPILVLAYENEKIDGLGRWAKRDFNKVFNKELQEDAETWQYFQISDLELNPSDELSKDGMASPLFIPAISVPYIADLDAKTKELLVAGVRVATNENKVVDYYPQIQDQEISATTQVDQAFSEFEAVEDSLQEMQQQMIRDNRLAVQRAEREEQQAKSAASQTSNPESTDAITIPESADQGSTTSESSSATPVESSAEEVTSAAAAEKTYVSTKPSSGSQATPSSSDDEVVEPDDDLTMQEQLRNVIANVFEKQSIPKRLSEVTYDSSTEFPELNLLAKSAAEQVRRVIEDGDALLSQNQQQTSKLVYRRASAVLKTNLAQIKRETDLTGTTKNQFSQQISALKQEKNSALDKADADIKKFHVAVESDLKVKREETGERARQAALTQFDTDHANDLHDQTLAYRTKLENGIDTHFNIQVGNVKKDATKYQKNALRNVVSLSLNAPTDDSKNSLETISSNYETETTKIIRECQSSVEKINDTYVAQSREILAKLAKTRVKIQKRNTQVSAETKPLTRNDLYQAVRDMQVVNPANTSNSSVVSSTPIPEPVPGSQPKVNKRPITRYIVETLAGVVLLGAAFGGGVLSNSHNEFSSAARNDSSNVITNSTSTSSSSHVLSNARSTNSSSSDSSKSDYLNGLKIGDAVTIRPDGKNLSAKVTSLNSHSVTVETDSGDQYSINK